MESQWIWKENHQISKNIFVGSTSHASNPETMHLNEEDGAAAKEASIKRGYKIPPMKSGHSLITSDSINAEIQPQKTTVG